MDRNNKFLLVLTPLVLAVFLASNAQASLSTFTTTRTFTVSGALAQGTNLYYSPFDPANGTLTDIVITSNVQISPWVEFINFTGQPQNFTNATTKVDFTLSIPASSSSSAVPLLTFNTQTSPINGTVPTGGVTAFTGQTFNQVQTTHLASVLWGYFLGTIPGSVILSAGFGPYTTTASFAPTSQGFFGVGGNGQAIGSVALDISYAYVTANNDTPTPIPTAAWLFGSGLLGLVGIRRRKKQ